MRLALAVEQQFQLRLCFKFSTISPNAHPLRLRDWVKDWFPAQAKDYTTMSNTLFGPSSVMSLNSLPAIRHDLCFLFQSWLSVVVMTKLCLTASQYRPWAPHVMALVKWYCPTWRNCSTMTEALLTRTSGVGMANSSIQKANVKKGILSKVSTPFSHPSSCHHCWKK